MSTSGAEEQPESAGFIEVERLRCSCLWATMDTGNAFYSRRVKPDPDCPVHRGD